jgi:LDH2 family malate/lactate/ureidoglycolate dehydrogenase
MKGFERIFLPGEQSQAKFAERLRDGVPVPEPLLAALAQLGAKLGIGSLGSEPML